MACAACRCGPACAGPSFPWPSSWCSPCNRPRPTRLRPAKRRQHQPPGPGRHRADFKIFQQPAETSPSPRKYITGSRSGLDRRPDNGCQPGSSTIALIDCNSTLKERTMKRCLLAMTAAVTVAAPALADLALATAKNCMACHAVDKKLVGPSYKDVAPKYAGQKDAAGQTGRQDHQGRLWRVGSRAHACQCAGQRCRSQEAGCLGPGKLK